jgi:hypothetical protein
MAWQKEPRRLPVACRPKAMPAARSSAEVDLSRIVSGNNPPSGTSRRGPVRRRSEDLVGSDVRRIQKTGRRHFSGAVTSDWRKTNDPVSTTRSNKADPAS